MKALADEAKLTAYALGEMNEIERVAFEQQLACSPELRAMVSDIQQMAALLREQFAAEKTPSALSSQELFATRKIVSLPGRRTWFAAGIAAAASIAVVLTWQFWFRDARDPASPVFGNTTMTVLKLEHHSTLDEQGRRTLSDVAKVSYSSGKFRFRQFVADLGPGLSLDIRRLSPWTDEGDRFNFNVSYQLEF